jgi:hypothetical protein
LRGITPVALLSGLESAMTIRTALALAILATVTVAPAPAGAADEYVLPFIATPNAPGGAAGGAEGIMNITVENGKSTVKLKVRGLYPDAVYTIWTAFNYLAPGMEKSTRHAPPSCSANGSSTDPLCAGGNWKGWADFPAEGNGVAPTAKISARFTDGMGPDPGATFTTNSNGDGQVTVRLDFDITTEAPVGNKDIIVQCAPVPGVKLGLNSRGNLDKICVDPGSTPLRVTSTWLREFIGKYLKADRAMMCANYDPAADPENFNPVTQPVDYAHALAEDTRLWQCVDPRTGMPRVLRYGFDHFRLANHLDDLTHGFIGGNGTDHVIDMVGMRACAVPPLPQLPAAGGLSIDYTCPVPAAKDFRLND